MNTPCFSPESITSMLAAGVQVAIFTTGQSNPYGAALARTVKITANPATGAGLTEQIDFNASALIAGIGTQAELMPALARLVPEPASGGLTWSEVCGETTESVSRLGPSI